MKFKKLKLTVSLLFVFAALSTPALACTYLSYPEPPLEYIVSRTETIFVGTLLRKNVKRVKEDGKKYDARTLLFRIDRAIKGKTGGTYTVQYFERVDKDSCSIELPNPRVGEQWTMFYGYRERGKRRQNVRAPELLSSKFEADDTEYVENIIRAVQIPRSTFYGQIEGLMGMYRIEPSTISKIELRSKDGSELIATTKIDNRLPSLESYGYAFSFADLRPGEYKIRIKSSFQYMIYPSGVLKAEFEPFEGSYKFDYPITILKNEPEFADFVLFEREPRS